MKISAATLALGLVIRSICFAGEIIELEDGKVIQLKDDRTWEYVEQDSSHTKGEPKLQERPAKSVRYAEEAVDIWDKALELGEVNYSNSVKLYLHYKNNTVKKVVGISTHVRIVNAFGNTVYDNTFQDETALEPMERARSDTYWHFDHNPFMGDLPYNRLWQMAQNGSGKIITHVVKVVFEDGTVLGSKSIEVKGKKKSTRKK